MCIVTADLDASVRLWCDVLGFTVNIRKDLPDGAEPGPETLVYPKLLDDAFQARGARSRMAILSSADGAVIELQEPQFPAVERTPPENLRYRHTGFHELGLHVDDIDGFFERVRAAGYETQTDYVWSSGTLGRSFLFYDHEGNLIQLWQDSETAVWS